MRPFSTLRRLLARFPQDRKVCDLRAVALEWDTLVPQLTRSVVVAIECVEDPLYFGLFAVLAAELRNRFGMRGELVLVHSISGAIGTNWKMKILRSILVRWPISMQWVRAFGPIVSGVAYRSVSLAHPLGDLIDAVRAVILWRRLRRSADFNLEVRGVPVGDLIIDSYLRFKPSPRFDRNDPFVISLIWQAHRDTRRAQAYMRRRPAFYLTTYSSYIEHGIPVRVALQNGVRVISFGSFSEVGKELTLADWFHTTNTDLYRRRFEALDNQEARLQEAERYLRGRFAGQLDPAMSYMRLSAYDSASALTAAPADMSGAVVVFLHDFYDSPHIYPDLVFDDFWTWICFTIEALQEAGVPFVLKPHPNQIELSDSALTDLKAAYPGVRFISPRTSNAQLAEAGMCCGVTMYGSVAHELAYFGVPSIACAKHPHHTFGFCRTSQTREQYRALLADCRTMTVNKAEMRRESLMFYYMHNLYGDSHQLELRERFIELWTACHGEGGDTVDVATSLRALRVSKGFQELVARLGAETRAVTSNLECPVGQRT